MSISLISVKCPECGANLGLEENRQQAFCSYCGAKILISNDNEYVVKQINEAEIKRAETEQIIQLKQIALEEQRLAKKEKEKKKKHLISILVSNLVTLVAFLLFILGIICSKDDRFISNIVLLLSTLILIVSSFLAGREEEGLASPIGAAICSAAIIFIAKHKQIVYSLGYDLDLDVLISLLAGFALIVSVINIIRNATRIYKQ